MYQRCPLQYKFRYVDGKKLPPDGPLVVGISVHSGIEHNYKEKFKTSKAANKNAVLDAYSTKFEDLKSAAEFEEPVSQAKDQGYAMLTKHYDEVAPTVQPVESPELPFEISVAGVKRRFVGYIDVIASLAGGVKRAVMDNKTTRRTFNEFETGVSEQLTAYAYAHKKIFKDKKLDAVGFDVLVALKSGIKPQRLISERDDDQLKRFERTVQMVELAIQSGIFYPTDNHAHCSWCGYADICHYKAKAIQRKLREDKKMA
jgi:CRISPR/Cas system-associated exonuclease Cas4 (RecB family)